MKDDKMDVEFLVAVMNTARPDDVKTFDTEKEAEYRKNVNDCNKESKCEWVFLQVPIYLYNYVSNLL